MEGRISRWRGIRSLFWVRVCEDTERVSSTRLLQTFNIHLWGSFGVLPSLVVTSLVCWCSLMESHGFCYCGGNSFALNRMKVITLDTFNNKGTTGRTVFVFLAWLQVNVLCLNESTDYREGRDGKKPDQRTQIKTSRRTYGRDMLPEPFCLLYVSFYRRVLLSLWGFYDVSFYKVYSSSLESHQYKRWTYFPPLTSSSCEPELVCVSLRMWLVSLSYLTRSVLRSPYLIHDDQWSPVTHGSRVD